MQKFALCMLSCVSKVLCTSMCLRVKGRCTMGWWLWVTLWVRAQPPSCPSSSGRSILHCTAIPTPLPAASSGQCDLAIVALGCVLHYIYRESWKPISSERKSVFSSHWGMMTLDKTHVLRLNCCVKALVQAKMDILSLFLNLSFQRYMSEFKKQQESILWMP